MKRVAAIAGIVGLASALGIGEAGAQTPAPKSPAKTSSSKASQPIQSTKQFAEHTGLLRTSTVVGMNVKDLSGKDAGKVEDVLVSSRGDVAYAIVSFGGFLGIGDKLHVVPWDAVIVDRDNKTVYLDVRKETLERAPSFGKDTWPDTDRGWGSEVRKSWSDASITASVKARLAAEKAATLVKVDVTTKQGVVELSGTVDSAGMKVKAADIARRVEGVRQVVNNLRVQS